jgi:hypothetical protein
MNVQLKLNVPTTLQIEYNKALSHLKKNKRYLVLQVSSKYFRVLNETGMPSLFLYVLFDIVDKSINNDWVIETGGYDERYPDSFNTNIYLYPRALDCSSFSFEKLFDYDSKTVNVFLDYITKQNIILAADLAYAPKFRKEYYKTLLEKIDDFPPRSHVVRGNAYFNSKHSNIFP